MGERIHNILIQRHLPARVSSPYNVLSYVKLYYLVNQMNGYKLFLSSPAELGTV